MIKKVFVLLSIVLLFLINTSYTQADHIGAGLSCTPTAPHCIKGYSCQPLKADPNDFRCQPSAIQDVFGKIKPPEALLPFVQKDSTGAGGISLFLSNLVVLIYGVAAIVLVFMLLWGAFNWITSEGEKEKIEAARNKIIHALIGIILFAVAFAVIQVLGTFTGFQFFVGQK